MAEDRRSFGQYYYVVPKGLQANLAFRRSVLEAGYADPEVAHELWIMCSRDMLFWINTFVYTFDPRKAVDDQFPVMPFITYAYQDPAFMEMQEAIGRHDLLVEKSRDMGLTWMCILTMEWFWQFRPMTSFMFSSRNEDLVIDANDPDSLFWKFDFVVEYQPSWLHAAAASTRTNRINLNTAATLKGSSRTTDLGRGGRRTAMLLDEFASYNPNDSYEANKASQHNTNCRLINSTPKGPGRCYDDLAKKDSVKTLRIHWSEHPEKRPGLYTTRDGQLHVIDHDYDFPDPPNEYKFILDGKLRSPWYDIECGRAAYPQEIAQELDIDSDAADFRFFTAELAEELRGEDMIQAPWTRGYLAYDNLKCEVEKFENTSSDAGNLYLWLKLDDLRRPPKGTRYVIGFDVAEGTGASNSVACVFEELTGVQVAEYASTTIPAHEFGRFGVALARWFNTAYMIWECQGPGRTFEREVISAGYRKYYNERIVRGTSVKRTNKPGWMPTKDAKRTMLTNFRKGLSDRICVIRSDLILKDAAGYIMKPDNRIVHVKAENTMDPTGARDSHGDRAMAAALAWSTCKAGRRGIRAPDKPKVVEGSFAWRRREAEKLAHPVVEMDW